ncbi:hypothetical protein [Janthinobacterium sp. NKUCC06_STL]|uniref:hypothetical protein n=1 Tax=Janthinobacterium sp. NKUCC06_STL TaxID=2842127 RepID=UPI001C5ADEDB|nr:hypothetical protein [Janthinobacterium sp. NKUCC06_STL]MBW3512204.1 hypothetical protein [Janthinobacterium sp. NKUCC06_STL]
MAEKYGFAIGVVAVISLLMLMALMVIFSFFVLWLLIILLFFSLILWKYCVEGVWFASHLAGLRHLLALPEAQQGGDTVPPDQEGACSAWLDR